MSTPSGEGRQLIPKSTIKDCGGEVLACHFAGDGALFAAAISDGTIHTYATKTPQVRVATLKAEDDRMPATALRFIPTPAAADQRGLLYSAYASGRLRVWHTSTKTCLHTQIVSEEALTALDCVADGSKCVVAGSDFVVHVVDMPTHTTIGTYGPGQLHRIHDRLSNPEGHTNRVFAVKCHPGDPALVLSAGWDNTVQLWDLRQQHPVKHLYGPFLGGDALDVDATREEILTGSYRKQDSLETWSLSTLTRTRNFSDRLDECWVYAAQYARTAPLIATAGGNKHELRIVGRNSGLKVASFTDSAALYTLDLHPFSTMLCAGGASRALYLFDVDSASPLL